MKYLGINKDGLAVSGVWNEDSIIPEGETLVKIEDEAEIGWLWNGTSWNNTLNYKRMRLRNYPTIGDQLDALFKAGAMTTEMSNKIQAVKDKYPKTELDISKI